MEEKLIKRGITREDSLSVVATGGGVIEVSDLLLGNLMTCYPPWIISTSKKIGEKLLEATKIPEKVFDVLKELLINLKKQSPDGTERTMAYNELFEILSWMPAKSAIKYSSSLCKWLCNIHKDPRFIKKQCIRSCGQDNGFFVQRVLKKYSNGIIELHVLPWQTLSAFGVSLESIKCLFKFGRILSSSNGILLMGPLSRQNIQFWVCNPATRECAALPVPEDFNLLVDDADFSPLIECYPLLGGVEFPNDYTIALPVAPEPAWEIVGDDWVENKKKQLLIYSNGRWEEELCDVSIEGVAGWDVRYDTPVVVYSDATKGLVIHYLCENDSDLVEPYIAAFDIRSKAWRRAINLPLGAGDKDYNDMWTGSQSNLWIFKWNDTSICLVRWLISKEITLWVLDDYDLESESWRRVMKKEEEELEFVTEEEWGISVGVVSGKRLLIATTKRVYVYVLEGEECGRLEVVSDHGLGFGDMTFIPYANTLRPVLVQNSQTFTY